MVDHNDIERKTRRRGELDNLSDNNYNSERYVELSSTKQCFLEGSRGLDAHSHANMRERSKRARHAATHTWETPPAAATASSSSSSSTGDRLTTDEMALRRDAIVYLFSTHGYPPEGEWGHEFGVLKDIMTKLAIPSQRIATLKERPTHPSAVRALDLIAQEADEEFERLDAARLQHELLAFAGEDEEKEDGDGGNNDEEKDDDDQNLALDPDSDEDTVDEGGAREDGDESDGEEF